MRYFFLALFFISAGFIGASTMAGAVNTPQALYENSDYAFSIKYPPSFTLHEKYDGVLFDKTTFMLQQGSTLASFIYNGSDYAGTNLVAAGIAIGKITPSETYGCKTVGMGEKTSGNLKFYHGVGATRLSSLLTNFDYYEVEGKTGCFMIQMSVEVDESSTKKPLSDQDRNTLKSLMEKTALTFAFATPGGK